MDPHLSPKNRMVFEFAERIRETFPDPGWPEDQRPGAYDDLDSVYINEHYTGKRWKDMTPDELDFAGMDSWAFTDAALAYFLPAFVVAELEGRLDRWSYNAEYWIPRLSPLRQWGYERPQIELLLEASRHLGLHWPTEVLLPLEQELQNWP